MRQLSLRIRSILLAVVLLALFAPFTIFILDGAYTKSLTQAKMSELRLMNLGLLSAFELDGDVPYMPEVLYEEQLNLPGSGYIGVIVFRDTVIWQSASALEYTLKAPSLRVDVGNELFLDNYETTIGDADDFFVYAFTAEFASSNQFEPVHFYILNDKEQFSAERETFVNTAWQWIATLCVVLLIFIIVGISLVLAPVRKLINEIAHAASGNKNQLEARYPVEFDSLKRAINNLLTSEAEQRSRYKNSLGDLAHSLKTPLAAAMGTNALPFEATESLTQIDNIIQRQLKRASAGKSGWQASITVWPLLMKLADAMDKVYGNKHLTISLDGNENAAFKGDQTDFMELCGNILDNACKAAKSLVNINVVEDTEWLIISIEDDGPGIPENERNALLARGARLDTYAEGQGIGMAIVSDLVAIYEGKLHIEKSHLGGARIQIKLPNS
ncbi:ATP-binding protein [Alteromonas sp. A079]|uniref:ATP-binding protein n=1 Tax=Alteromonas sp. A079 TaxID=3410268 RepID=UPI003B9F0FC6